MLCADGSEAYSAVLIFYSSVKGGSNISGSRAIYDDLAQRFPGDRHKTAAEA
jgi:hypothetical protein